MNWEGWIRREEWCWIDCGRIYEMGKDKGLAEFYQKQLEIVLQRLKDDYKPEKVILFGSLVQGKVSEGSDIDLLVVKKTNKPYFDRAGEVLFLLDDVQVAVDPQVYTPGEYKRAIKENRSFLEEVRKTGKVVYG